MLKIIHCAKPCISLHEMDAFHLLYFFRITPLPVDFLNHIIAKVVICTFMRSVCSLFFFWHASAELEPFVFSAFLVIVWAYSANNRDMVL